VVGLSPTEPTKSEAAVAMTLRAKDGLIAALKRLGHFLKEREYRPLWHLLAVLFIIGAAAVIFYRNYPPHGTLMYTDMTWPNTLARLRFYLPHTWWPYGSYPISGGQLWFYWIYPTASLASLFHIPASAYMFLTFWGTFSLAGISMYALAVSTIRSHKLPDTATYAPYIGAVLAALVFMYNPWSLMYLREYFGYPVYALSPLLFLAMVKTFDSPRLRNIILFSLFVVLVNTSHHLIWFWALFASYLLFFLITNRFARDKVKGALKVAGGTLAFYLLLGAAWIMPYLGSLASSKPLLPYYSPAFTQASLQGLSSNNTILNNFRLVSFWTWSLSTVNTGAWLQVLAFAIPVLAVLSFLLMRKHVRHNRVVNYWAAVAVLALLLATGSSFILKKYFLYFSMHAPGSSFYGWMLRATERWLFFVPVFFALMIGILVTRLLIKRPKPFRFPDGLPRGRRKVADLNSAEQERLFLDADERVDRLQDKYDSRDFLKVLIVAVIVIALVLVSLIPVAAWFARTIFNPADVPADYQKVYDFLAKQPDGGRVAWVPFFSLAGYDYSWAPGKTVGPYSILSSQPNLSSYQVVSDEASYFKWLESLYLKWSIPTVQFLSPELMLSHREMSRLFAPFATRYLVFDRSVTGYSLGDSFTAEKSLKPVYRTKYLTVYRTDYDPGYITAVATSARVDSFFENLSVAQSLPLEQLARFTFLNGASYFGGSSAIARKYGVVDIKDYLIPLTVNGGFEEGDPAGMPPGWYFTYDNGKTSVSASKDKAEGKRSMKVVNSSDKAYDLDWITTWPEPARPGDIYTFETSMKYRNVDWSLAVVEGYQESTGQWIRLIACPSLQSGDSGWKKYRCSLRVPEGFTKIRPALGSGWSKAKRKGPGVTWFDGVRLSKVSGQFLADLTSGPPAPKVTYQQIDPEKFKVKVKGATAPFLLVLGELYDGHWVASLGGRTIDSVPVYSTINGFPINKTGDFELTVSYSLHSWLTAGFTISFLTILVFLAYLSYFWRARLTVAARYAWRPTRRMGLRFGRFLFPPRER